MELELILTKILELELELNPKTVAGIGIEKNIFDASKIKRFIAMGDWNIDAKKNSLFGKRLRDICQQNDAQIHTCGPTYFYGQGSMSSELDYFITRGFKGDFTVVRFANSDHDAIKAVLPVNQTSATDERKTIQI